MEQDKTKILSDLYAIRATMSVVAKNEDEVKPERAAITRISQEQTQADNAISNSEKILGETLYKKRNVAKKQIEELNEERKKREKAMASFPEDSFVSEFWDSLWYDATIGPTFGVILVILFIASIALTLNSPVLLLDFNGNPFLIMLSICLSGVVCYLIIICIYVACARSRKKRNDERRKSENSYAIQQIDRKLKIMTEQFQAYDERINEVSYSRQSRYRKVIAPKYHYPEVDGLIKLHEDKVAEYEFRKAELEEQKGPHNETIVAIAQRSQKIIDSAIKAYPLIDFRDWENVDLIIYYFETGRADDMKEALQLVDRQRQTDQIARAIAMASREICRTFDDSMRRLGSALAQSFSVLSRQMAQQHAELMAGMEQQAEAQRREIRAQTAEQINAQAMNQALLEKISVSSLDLAEKMARQMREVHGLY